MRLAPSATRAALHALVALALACQPACAGDTAAIAGAPAATDATSPDADIAATVDTDAGPDALPDAATDATSPDADVAVTADADVASPDAFAGAATEAPSGCTPSFVDGAPSSDCPVFSQTWTCPASAGFTAMAATSDGGVLLVGGIDSKAWIVREDALGQVLWQKEFPALGEAVDVTATVDGGWAIIGGGWALQPGPAGTSGYPAFVLKLSDSGAVQWLDAWPGPFDAGVNSPGKVVALPDGGVAIAITFGLTLGHNAAAILRLSATGSPLWTSTHADTQYGTDLRGMVRLSNGAFALVYREACCGGSQWTLGIWDAIDLPPSASQVVDELLVVRADGAVLAGCTLGSGKSGWFASTVRNYDASWGIVWETWLTPVPTGEQFPNSSTVAFAAFPDGGSITSSDALRWSKVGATGQFAWQRSATAGNAVAAFPDGSFAAAGTANPIPTLLRADRWGNVTCKDAIPCAAKAANACDDGNGCTSDYCLAPGDCTHVALDDQTPCGNAPDYYSRYKPAPKMCFGGKCVAK